MKFVFPQMEKTFAARVDAVEGGMKRAAAVQAEANEVLEQYRAELAQARTEAARIRDEARADAEGMRQGVLSEAREESHRIVAVGGEQLAAQREHILSDLRSEVSALAVDLASRIVGEPLADKTRERGEFGVSALPSD
jgi:F-type H+-transporting ATPase subunit b